MKRGMASVKSYECILCSCTIELTHLSTVDIDVQGVNLVMQGFWLASKVGRSLALRDAPLAWVNALKTRPKVH